MDSSAVIIARMVIGTLAGLGVLTLDLLFYKHCVKTDNLDLFEVLVQLGGVAAGLSIIAYSIGGIELLNKVS